MRAEMSLVLEQHLLQQPARRRNSRLCLMFNHEEQPIAIDANRSGRAHAMELQLGGDEICGVLAVRRRPSPAAAARDELCHHESKWIVLL